MSERIVDVNIQKQSEDDMREYSVYVARYRAVPSCIDGLKTVVRRILYCAAHDFKGQGFIKTAAMMGQVIGELKQILLQQLQGIMIVRLVNLPKMFSCRISM